MIGGAPRARTRRRVLADATSSRNGRRNHEVHHAAATRHSDIAILVMSIAASRLPRGGLKLALGEISSRLVSSQMPKQRPHSLSSVSPSLTRSSGTEQSGQLSPVSPSTGPRDAAAPQWGQCLLPANIMPKQDGQATVARRAPQ